MADPFLGQLKIFAGTYAPVGWVLCDGRLLPIAENDALFNLLGTTFGGDGYSTFGVPDLRGRVPIAPGTDSDGNTYIPGQAEGSEGVTLTEANGLPPHSHAFVVSTAPGTEQIPAGNLLAAVPSGDLMFRAANPSGSMVPGVIALSAGGSPHENRQPFLVVNYIMATEGIYPSQP